VLGRARLHEVYPGAATERQIKLLRHNFSLNNGRLEKAIGEQGRGIDTSDHLPF